MLKRTLRGEPVLDPKTNTTRALQTELRAAAESLSTTSKGGLLPMDACYSIHFFFSEKFFYLGAPVLAHAMMFGQGGGRNPNFD